MATYKIYKSLSLLTLLFLCINFSCTKNSQAIPYVAVSVQINVSNPDYFALKSPGGWVYVTGGSKGIVVYRLDMNTFKAYDRHCPYQPENECSRIAVESSQLTAKDTCCSSVFQLMDGSIIGGPADRNLQEYKTSFDGNILSIYN
jgi:nitrite reductase/ring-hydroxylating ferredoxin subunit